MRKLKSVVANPIVLAVQGFVLGATLLWTNAISLDAANAASPTPIAAEAAAS